VRKRPNDTDLAQRLAEALGQEAATSRILHAMARSPADVQPVFDAIANAALDLCRASSAVVLKFDGELLHIAALASVHPSGAEALRSAFPRPPSHDTAATRAALTGIKRKGHVLSSEKVDGVRTYRVAPDGGTA